jgi:hypothetical protein
MRTHFLLLFVVACSGDPRDQLISQSTGEAVNGDFALLFADTSTERIDTGDWDACRGKASCAPGETLRGLSVVPGGDGRMALCHPAASGAYTGEITATLTLDGNADQRRTERNGDWAHGYWKLECGEDEYVTAVSENAMQCFGDRRFHAVRCAKGTSLGKSCTVRNVDAGDDRASTETGDWDFGNFKAECGSNEYVAGISVSPGTGRPHSLLCCGAGSAPSQQACSKIGVQSQDRSAEFTQVLEACPRVVKWFDPDFAAMRDFKARCPGSSTVLRIFGANMDRPTGDEFWTARYAPVLGNASAADKAAVDFLESDNECDAGWCTKSIDDARGYNTFLEQFVARAKAEGWKPLIFNIGVGNPDGEIASCGDEGMLRFGAMVPSILAAGAAGGGWSYHGYTWDWQKNPDAQSWSSLRYRRYANCFPEVKSVPLILTEAGFDKGGNPNTDGYAVNGGTATYLDWLGWWQRELAADSYVLGATLFAMSSDPYWASFRLNPIVNELVNRIRTCD